MAAARPPANGLTPPLLIEGGADSGCGHCCCCCCCDMFSGVVKLPEDGGGGNAVLETLTCPYFSCKFLSDEEL